MGGGDFHWVAHEETVKVDGGGVDGRLRKFESDTDGENKGSGFAAISAFLLRGEASEDGWGV